MHIRAEVLGINLLQPLQNMEQQYLALLRKCVCQPPRQTRNATTHGLFGETLTHDLSESFPLITTKRVFFRGVIEELAWFLRGSTNVDELRDKAVMIWNQNAEDYDPEHKKDVGAMYGFSWRHFGAHYQGCTNNYDGEGVDQVASVIRNIKEDPHSRRHIISAWNPSAPAALPPCHVLYQFHVQDHKLSVQMYQRSADLFLGVPFNIASTALLTHLIASECNLNVGTMRIVFGDVHVYASHLEAVRTQLQRVPRCLPTLRIVRPKDGLWNVQTEDVQLFEYNPHPTIRANMIV